MQPILVASTKTQTYAATFRGLFATQDHGHTWTNITPTGDSTRVNSVVIGQDGALYAESATTDLYMSTDGGGTESGAWTNPGKSAGLTLVLKNGTLFAVNDDIIQRSINAGHDWTDLPSVDPIHKRLIFGLFIDNKNQLFASTDSGIYISKDLGNTWLESSQGFHGVSSTRYCGAAAVGQDKLGNYYAASHGQGVFRSIATSGVGRSQFATQTQSLECYPNPASSRATIQFELPAASSVTLSVFDPLGRSVWSHEYSRLEAGPHEIPFNATDLASGAYLCTLRSATGNFSGRIVVTHE